MFLLIVEQQRFCGGFAIRFSTDNLYLEKYLIKKELRIML